MDQNALSTLKKRLKELEARVASLEKPANTPPEKPAKAAAPKD